MDKELTKFLSESVENEEFRNVLTEYVKMRKTIKKPLTLYALKLAIAKVEKLAVTNEERIAIVNQSILNSWQGLYPVKQCNNNTNPFIDMLEGRI